MHYSSPSLQLWQRTPWTTAWALPCVHNINLSCDMGWNFSCARKEMYSMDAFKFKYGFILKIKLLFHQIMLFFFLKKEKNSGCSDHYHCKFIFFLDLGLTLTFNTSHQWFSKSEPKQNSKRLKREQDTTWHPDLKKDVEHPTVSLALIYSRHFGLQVSLVCHYRGMKKSKRCCKCRHTPFA